MGSTGRPPNNRPRNAANAPHNNPRNNPRPPGIVNRTGNSHNNFHTGQSHLPGGSHASVNRQPSNPGLRTQHSGVRAPQPNFHKHFFNNAKRGNTSVDNLTRIRHNTHASVRKNVFGANASDGSNDSPNAILIKADKAMGCISGNTLSIKPPGRTGHATIALKRRMGSKGITWLAMFGKVPMYVRRVPLQNEDELVRLQEITRLHVPFFPKTYGAARCNLGRRGSGKGYYVVLTEAFHGSLAQWLNVERQPTEFVSAFMQVMVALAAVHAHRLVHGAITPKNVVFNMYPRSAGWWEFDVGATRVNVKKSTTMFALGNMGHSASWNAGPVRSPPCEVRDVLRMFGRSKTARSSGIVSRDILRRMQAMYELAESESLDAPAFLQNTEVMKLLRGMPGQGVQIGNDFNANSHAVKVVPREYMSYEGPVECGPSRGNTRPGLRGAMGSLREAMHDMRRRLHGY